MIGEIYLHSLEGSCQKFYEVFNFAGGWYVLVSVDHVASSVLKFNSHRGENRSKGNQNILDGLIPFLNEH